MWEACYFLDVSSLEILLEERFEGGKHTEGRERSGGQVTLQKLEALLDEERLSKYQGIQNKKVTGACLGAGLLLRLAATEFEYFRRACLQENRDLSGGLLRDFWEEHSKWEKQWQSKSKCVGEALRSISEKPRILTPKDIFERMRQLPSECQLELRYHYGKAGKPYWDGIPLFFSLSHSGDLVGLAVSEQELGLDVQRVTGTDWKKLAERFYSVEEQEELWGLCEQSEELGRKGFFRLWCQKESYGKLTGEGVLPYLCKRTTEFKNIVFFEKELELSGNEYCFALCKGRVNGREK
jgi:hypothetical protein